MPTGTATLNFGAAPGSNTATVDVLDSGVSASSKVEGWLSSTTHADRTAEEMQLLSSKVGILAHSVQADVGFSITATTELRLTGNINVDWVWV